MQGLTMYRSLLVPLDGSTFSEHALPMAAAIARRANAVLHVVRVHEPLVSVGGDAPLAFSAETERRINDEEQSYLAAVANRLSALSSLSVTTHLEEGLIVDGIMTQAQGRGADLIVMTTHGRGPVTRFWLGSVTDELVRRAAQPILLVRSQETPPDIAKEPIVRRILIPLDGSSLAEQVLAPATTLGELMQAEHTLLLVITPTSLPKDLAGGVLSDFDVHVLERLRMDGQAYLDRIAQPLRARSLQVQTSVVIGQQSAAGILDEARRQDADVIALATHGRHGLQRLRLGSVADKVLRGASCAVLLYRPLKE